MSMTYQEIGALLSAVGEIMLQRNLCAEAVLDGDSDDDLIAIMIGHGIEEGRARELCRVDLAEAVQFIDA